MRCAEFAILLHRALEARIAVLMERVGVPGWEEDPGGLHDVRVASRRLRAVLELVEPGLYPGWRRQRRRLKRLTRALGRTREADVHLAILEELGRREPGLAAAPAMEHALELAEAHRRHARRSMARRLSRLDLKRLPHLLAVPSLPDPFRAGDLRRDVWACLEPSLEGAFPPPELLDRDDAAALHALRIRIKRLRYALEILEPGFGTAPSAQLDLLRSLQAALGAHHDQATLEAGLEALLHGLEARGRPTLAAGTRRLLGHVAEERGIAFEQFRALAVGVTRADFAAALRAGLGLGDSAEGTGAP